MKTVFIIVALLLIGVAIAIVLVRARKPTKKVSQHFRHTFENSTHGRLPDVTPNQDGPAAL